MPQELKCFIDTLSYMHFVYVPNTFRYGIAYTIFSEEGEVQFSINHTNKALTDKCKEKYGGNYRLLRSRAAASLTTDDISAVGRIPLLPIASCPFFLLSPLPSTSCRLYPYLPSAHNPQQSPALLYRPASANSVRGLRVEQAGTPKFCAPISESPLCSFFFF